jgi:hypothetical protein
MALLRKRQLQSFAQLSGEERERFLHELPAPKEKIEALFVYLNDALGEEWCTHDLRNTMKFLVENHLNIPKMMTWLNENGGYCDCEILKNIEEEWEKAFEEEKGE